MMYRFVQTSHDVKLLLSNEGGVNFETFHYSCLCALKKIIINNNNKKAEQNVQNLALLI